MTAALSFAPTAEAAAWQRLAETLAAARPGSGLDPTAAAAMAHEARGVARALGRAEDQARAGAWLCTHLYLMGRFAEMLDEAADVLRHLNGPALEAERRELLRVVAICACDRGAFAVGLDAAQQLAAMSPGHDEQEHALASAFAMAVCLERMGDSWHAIRRLEVVLQRSQIRPPSLPLLQALNMMCAIHIGAFHRLSADPPDPEAAVMLEGAHNYGQQAQALLGDVGNPVYAVTVRGNLGETLIYKKDASGAQALLEQARDEAAVLGLKAHGWRIECSLGALLLTSGRAQEALQAMVQLGQAMGESAPRSTAIRLHHVAYKACCVLDMPALGLAHFTAYERLERLSMISQLRAQSDLFVTRAEAEQQMAQTRLAREDARVHRERAAALADSAEQDPLTGLGNRRKFDRVCAELLCSAQRNGRPVALALVDADFFKAVNDRYGHAAGDRVLQALAQLLRENTRGRDVTIRHGGEEFLIMLPDTTLDSAVEVCERVRERVAAHPWWGVLGDALARPVTISIGLAVAPPFDAHALLLQADGALYQAKHLGRNRLALAAADVADPGNPHLAGPRAQA